MMLKMKMTMMPMMMMMMTTMTTMTKRVVAGRKYHPSSPKRCHSL